MGKLSLLKEYLKLAVKEAAGEGPAAPFQLTGPVAKPKRSSTYTIYREFPIVPTPEMMQALRATDAELEGGVLLAEHEIGIDITDVYHEKEERRTWTHPGNPESWLIEGWEVETLNGLQLTPQDAKALQNYIGELTEDEQDSLIEQYIDGLGEPDYDDGDYDPYY